MLLKIFFFKSLLLKTFQAETPFSVGHTIHNTNEKRLLFTYLLIVCGVYTRTNESDSFMKWNTGP